ncbi:hypothetical protein [Alteriqipengyuania sp.]|uniref:hypothetical protein n=1 Tax=Alteriqipengyuania sp. TaxID=2800692 RepID=UPI003518E5DF
MFKGASQSLQRAHGVSGLIAESQPSDALPETAAMSLEELHAERALLIQQKTQLEIEVKAQKNAGHTHAVRGAGYRIQTLCSRLSEVNAAIKARNAMKQEELRNDTLKTIYAAVRAHLEPDGIDAGECLSRVIDALEVEVPA